MGVYAASLVEPIARVLAELGSEHALVVHGVDGLDEITTTGPTRVGEVRDGAVFYEVAPEELGIGRADLADLAGGDPEENARAMERVLGGEGRRPARGRDRRQRRWRRSTSAAWPRAWRPASSGRGRRSPPAPRWRRSSRSRFREG